MVSVFGFDVFGLRIVRLVLLNIIILLLNLSLWSNDSDSKPQRDSLDLSWKARLRNPPSPLGREEVTARREFQFDYDEDVQREAAETWRKTARRVNKKKSMVPMSARVLNGTKRILRREKRRNMTTDEAYARYQVLLLIRLAPLKSFEYFYGCSFPCASAQGHAARRSAWL